jgi:hypothetical protein
MNEMDNKRTSQRISETKSLSFETKNNIEKPLIKPIIREREDENQ